MNQMNAAVRTQFWKLRMIGPLRGQPGLPLGVFDCFNVITVGQRPGFKYWYDKEWLSRGHMHGLAFLEENYSHQNAKKIVATHQLLGDVQRVIEVLHGLQLKMSILQ